MAIQLSVHLRKNLDDSEVRASGFELLPLNDAAAKAFGIPRQIVGRGSHDGIWACINNWWGRVPDEFVTSDPVKGSSVKNVPDIWTPYSDSWGEENQVRIERKAVGCELVSHTGGVDALVTDEVENLSHLEQPGQSVSLSHEEVIEDSRHSEKSWSMSLTNGIEVTVGGEFAGLKAEAKRSIEFTVEHGGSSGRSHSKSVGQTVARTANVTAAPRKIYPVSLVAGRGSLKVRVDYEYRIFGEARALYIQKAFNGQLSSPGMDITEILRWLNLPTVVNDSEVLDVGFVTSGKISIGEGRSVD